jgi:hypothetical protein
LAKAGSSRQISLVEQQPVQSQSKISGKFYLFWFLSWTGLLFVVFGPFLGFTHGQHIATSAAVGLAFLLSIFVSAASTFVYWVFYTFCSNKFTVEQHPDDNT